MTRLGIIGATGWLGSALTRALLANDLAPATSLVLLNRSGARPPDFAHSAVTWATDPADLVARADAVILSVRPEDFPALALHAPGRLVVSFMAGVTMATLAATGGRIVRALPNAAADLGRSYTPWLAAPDVTAADRTLTRALLSRIGTEDEVATESQIDTLTALSGSGAAYPALLAQAMLDHARAHLPEPIALRATEAAVCDGARLLQGRIGDAATLLAAYRAYKGTTAAGLDAAEQGGFTQAVAAALDAATRKAALMGQPPSQSPRPE